MKKTRYILEYILFLTVIKICQFIGLKRASYMTGWLARMIGPWTKKSHIAQHNLKSAFPLLCDQDIAHIISRMWDNLGRVFGEYPYLSDIAKSHVKIENEHILDCLKESDKPAIFISAHLGNWEISGPALLKQLGISISPVYRAPNNPYIEKMIKDFRSLNGLMNSFPKSPSGNREMIKALKNGQHIAIIFDQKYNQGIPLPFFHDDASTSTAFADLAIKFDCPIIAGQIIREKGCDFRLVLHGPIDMRDNNGHTKKSHDIVHDMNQLLEQWIKDNPEQWLWVHRRWPDKNQKTIQEKA